MAPKGSRFELRLDEAIVEKIDAWRSAQPDFPSRSAAVRQLVLAGLGSEGGGQVFELARFQLLTAALNPSLSSSLPSAYVYAWDEGVYPLFHEGFHLHRPFATSFRITKSMVEELFDYFDALERRQQVPTFYEVEDHYQVRYGGTDWDRVTLIQASRYMFLHHNMWGDAFWARLLAKMEHPTEASGIIRPFGPDQIYLS